MVDGDNGLVQFLQSDSEGFQDANHVGGELIALLKTLLKFIQLDFRLRRKGRARGRDTTQQGPFTLTDHLQSLLNLPLSVGYVLHLVHLSVCSVLRRCTAVAGTSSQFCC